MKHTTRLFDAFLLLALTALPIGVCQANQTTEPLMDVSCRIRSIPESPLIYDEIALDQNALGKAASSRPAPLGAYWVSLSYTGKSKSLRSVVLTVQNKNTSEELFYGWLRLVPGVPQYIKVQNRVSVECFIPEKGSGLNSDPENAISIDTPTFGKPGPTLEEQEEAEHWNAYRTGAPRMEP